MNHVHVYLVIQPHVHHGHLSHHLDPAGATGVVRVDTPPEPHLENQKEADVPGYRRVRMCVCVCGGVLNPLESLPSLELAWMDGMHL